MRKLYKKEFSVCFVAAFLFINTEVFSADMSFVGSIDTTSTGKVSTGKLLKKGHLKASLFIDSSAYGVPLNKFAIKGSYLAGIKDKLLTKSNRTSLFVGYGVFDWMELDLGLRATTDEIDDNRRLEIFQRHEEGEFFERDVSASKSGNTFAGSVLTAKFMVLNRENLKLGMAGFFEEGSGEKARYSASLSESAKIGYMAILSYGYKSFGQATANIGYRSRRAEEIGGKHIGNEIFSRFSAMYHLTQRWGAYTTIELRNIKVADTLKPDSAGYLDYKSEIETASQLGVTGYLYKNYKMDAYVGGGLNTQSSVGNSERYFGLSLTVPIIGSQKRGIKDSLTQKNDKKILEKINKKKHKNDKKADKKRNRKKDPLADYPEMKKPSKLFEIQSNSNDFSKAKRNWLKRPKGKTVDLDKEVEKYKKKDAMDEAREEAPKYSLQERRENYKRYLIEKKKTEKEVSKRLQRELGDFEITKEDANWTGLED